MNFKEKYTKEIDTLQFSHNFEAVLLDELQKAAERKEDPIMKKRKTVKVLVAVISAILLLSVSAFAITAILSAQEVADELGESQLVDKWQKSEKFPYVSCDENYTVSVLGIATDKEINSDYGVTVEESRSYIVVSIQRNDGLALSLKEGSPIQLTPLISGYEPWKINLWTLGSNAQGLEKDGVLYYLFDTADLEVFADRTVYIAAYEGFIPSEDTLIMNGDGTIAFNENYTGFKALFELPLDESKAEPEKAEEIISQIW